MCCVKNRLDQGFKIVLILKYTLCLVGPHMKGISVHGEQYNIKGNTVIILTCTCSTKCYCCYSKPILDVADNKFAESAAVLMLIDLIFM
jgi:hypothetical protein